ncbi:MAG: M48 family peptidase [Acholeplasmatales bacterium]|nr:MAG: M48 family peptidase [Acholeplasmatales bacterium]
MIFWLIIGILLVVYAVELWLAVLNLRQRNKPLPENVADIFDEERYRTWRNYQSETYRLMFIGKSLRLLVLLALLALGGFAYFVELAESVSGNAYVQTLVFLGLYQVIVLLIGWPLSYYRTFSIDERYGFNRSTKKLFVIDKIKGVVLLVVLGGGLVLLFQVIFSQVDNIVLFAVIAWAVAFAIVTLIAYLYTAVFVKIFNKIDPLPEGELREKIEALADTIGFKVKAISQMDASKRSTRLNAFFSGFGKNKDIVLFDTLIEKMETDQILAVLAHEFAHGKHKDVQRMFIQQALVFALYTALVAVVLQTEALYTAFGLNGIFFGFALIMFMVLISPIEFLLGVPLSWLSRRAEYRADAFAAGYLGASSMIGALKVLAKEDLADLNPHPYLVTAYYSHPPMSLRIGALEALQKQ